MSHDALTTSCEDALAGGRSELANHDLDTFFMIDPNSNLIVLLVWFVTVSGGYWLERHQGYSR